MAKLKTRNAARTPTREDVYFGERIKEARVANNMLLRDLAALVGVSYQQLQKYESGQNRVNSARIEMLVTALNRPLAYFFPNATDVRAHLGPVFSSVMTTPDGQTLLHAYVASSPKKRRLIVELAVELSEGRH